MTDDAFGSGFDQPITATDTPQAAVAPALPAPVDVAPAPVVASAAPAQQSDFLQGGTMPGAAAPSGLSDNYHRAIGQIESSGGAAYGNGGGIYQFIPSTAKALGVTQDQIRAMTPEQQTALAERFTAQNTAALSKAGLPVNDTTAYLAHQQGPAGAVKLLQADPNAPAASVVGEAAAQGNKPFFYNADGSPKTVAQTLDTFRQKVTAAGGAGAPVAMAGRQAPTSAEPSKPMTTGERMKAWLAQQPVPSQPAQQPEKEEEPQHVAQLFGVGQPVSSVIHSGGKVFFQRYGRVFDTNGNQVG
jgi:hypothetical protein